MMAASKSLIVYGGAFNPPTKAHLAALRALAARAGEDEVILLPSGEQFIRLWKPGQDVLPDIVRLDLLRQMADEAGCPNIRLDLQAMRENLCTYDALAALKARYGAQEALFVMGEDKLPELPRWAHARELVESTRFLLLNYEKSGRDSLTLPGLDVPVRVEYVLLPSGTEETHAAYLRGRMRRHDPSLLKEDTGRHLAKHPECLRLAACAPLVHLANPEKNRAEIQGCMERTDADILIFPELAVSGYTCGDLFLSPAFLDACEKAAAELARATRETGQIVYVGCPVRAGNRLYNCAVAAFDGRVQAVIPKTYLANYNEFYEERWFSSASDAEESLTHIRFAGEEAVPFGTDVLLRSARGHAVIAAEICEDAWVPLAPSMRHCMAGANVVVNLSASNDLVAKTDYRRDMLRMLSARGICAYVYASCGAGESTSDVVYGGQKMIFQNGRLLSASQQPLSGVEEESISAVVDLSMLDSDRLRMKSFADARFAAGYRFLDYDQPTFRFPAAPVPQPFIPAEEGEQRKNRCLEILSLQARGLCQRIRSIGIRRVVIGISGGLDSTLALIVAHTAFDALKLPPEGIIAVTMPGFATSGRTLKNATDLCHQFGTDFRQVDITAACTLHGQDIGHDPEKLDITYENIQARERTQILMDIANMEGGIVVGTGDLSELALGWCTYNGDHMSHYGVNCGVPKTLVQFIVRTYAMHCAAPDTRETLLSILNTEITPELVPGGASTEERIGQYALHDFFLYHFMRYGFDREKLRFLAAEAFGASRIDEIDKTLNIFFSRFFASQFKRNCLPDGPKIGSVAVSPRGDLRLPADCGDSFFRT